MDFKITNLTDSARCVKTAGDEYSFLYPVNDSNRANQVIEDPIELEMSDELKQAFQAKAIEISASINAKNSRLIEACAELWNELKYKNNAIDRVTAHKKEVGIARWNAYAEAYSAKFAEREEAVARVEVIKGLLKQANESADTSSEPDLFSHYFRAWDLAKAEAHCSSSEDTASVYTATGIWIADRIDYRNGNTYACWFKSGKNTIPNSVYQSYLASR